MNLIDAEEYTQSLEQVVSGGWRQVALGVRLGVPKALGLTTRQWADRLGGYAKLSMPDRREAVKELTDEGMSTREIGAVLGVSNFTVNQDVRNLTPGGLQAREINVLEDADVRNLTPTRSDGSRKSPVLTHTLCEGIRRGDFREVLSDIPDSSIPLILTDPPYGKEYLPLWEDLAIFSSRVLSVNGLLLCYSGQMYLPEIIASMHKHLSWWWMGAVIHQGSGNLTPLGYPARKVINELKPLLFWVKSGCGYPEVFRDKLDGVGPGRKSDHNWSQPIYESMELVSRFSKEGDIVVDPFAGSGSVGVACEKLGRKFIGAEILTSGQTS